VLQNIPTGCEAVDKTLRGGIPAGSLSLIYGEPETGKTTLAMQCAVNCARLGHKALFMDCDGTFSSKRLSQLSAERLNEVVERIVLMKPNDFHEQTAAVDLLMECVVKDSGLVVIDTITSLYRVGVAESPAKTFELNRELNRQMAFLAQVAKTKKIAVLITSQVRATFNDASVSVEPVGTRVLKFWADTIIALKPTERPQVIRAVLEKNLRTVQSLTWLLKIEEAGIRNV
jgi:DNA repair and recombination protein RadB